MSNLAPDAIKEMLDLMVGSTYPCGSHEVDMMRIDNVDRFEAVCEWVFERLADANEYYDSREYSVSALARKTINSAGDLALLFDVESGRCEWLTEVE